MKRNRTKRLWYMLAVLGIGIGCAESEAPSETPVRPVHYTTVQSTEGGRIRVFSGVVRSGVQSTLSFRVAGSIEQLAVSVGDRVDAGQLIARVDAVDYELQVREAQAALRQAEAQASNSEANLQRVRGLYEGDNASRADLDAAVASAASASAMVDSLGKRVELAQRRADYARLKAPVDGSIAEVRVEVNENVAAGQDVVLLTSDLEQEVEVAIPESLIGQMEAGKPVAVTFAALPGRTVSGVVTEVGVMATALGTTFPVRVRLSGPTPDVRSGMAADVTFDFADPSAELRFVVAPEAVGEDREGRFVFLAEPTGNDIATVRRRRVTIGEFVADGLEILDGLSEGDLLITAGVSKIEDGMQVRLPIQGS